MALDGIAVRAVVHELQRIVGSRLNKIYQPNDHDLVLQLRAERTNLRLLLSASATYPRAHFTEQSFQNPLEAPMFCMLMRKHCEAGTIVRINQVGMERIIHIDVRTRDELGDLSTKRIIVELMGRHSNIILIDPQTGLIYDGIRHVTPAISAHRIVLPGAAYKSPPERDKLNPLVVSKAQFIQRIGELEQERSTERSTERPTERPIPYARWIVECFEGISPQTAAEICERAGLKQAEKHETGNAASENAHALADAFAKYMNEVAHDRYQPVIVKTAQGKSVFSVLPLDHVQGESESFPSVSACLDAYYGNRAEQDLIKQKTADLRRFVQNEISKNEKKLEKLRETIIEAEQAEEFRKKGELLTANLHRIERGDKHVEVIDYYDEAAPTMVIPLDPRLSPSENAQRWFKKYTKSKNSVIAVEAQIEAAQKEIYYFESLLQQLETAAMSDIDEIREELIAGQYLRRRGKPQDKKKKSDRPRVTRYTSSEGTHIYVGKNNAQNDYLTTRLAHANDTWLHTKDIPGSHVVIRGQDFGEATLNEAAMLAAYYSKGRTSSRVPVDYTLIRHVRKPHGAKPGFVIYDSHKTLYVTPDEEQIQSLPSSQVEK